MARLWCQLRVATLLYIQATCRSLALILLFVGLVMVSQPINAEFSGGGAKSSLEDFIIYMTACGQQSLGYNMF